MPRDLSANAIAAGNAAATEEVFLSLVTIAHDDLDEPIRLVNDHQDVVSRGNTFSKGGFEMKLPEETGEKMPSVTLTIDNVDLAMIPAIRALTSPAIVTHEVVLASSPGTVEAGPFTYTTSQFAFTAESIVVQLVYEDVLNATIPFRRINPTDFPGVFN